MATTTFGQTQLLAKICLLALVAVGCRANQKCGFRKCPNARYRSCPSSPVVPMGELPLRPAEGPVYPSDTALSQDATTPSPFDAEPTTPSDSAFPEPSPLDSIGRTDAGARGAPQFAGGPQTGAGGRSTIALATDGGYIDSAIPMTVLRVRYDAAYRNPTPDRAEFLYAQCGCFGPPAPGPPEAETGIDFQDIRAHMELALWQRFSTFVEVPVRFLNPDNNANTAGLGDIEAGFKYAWIASPNRFLTTQLRVFAPSADVDAGLGTGHVSLEPALLYFQRLSDRLRTESEFRVWVPISDSIVDVGTDQVADGVNFAGTVLRYGVGVNYDLFRGCKSCRCSALRLTSVTEFVGWTVLDGLVLDANRVGPMDQGVTSRADTTVFNLKLGLRWTAGRHSVYTGYGRALTGAVWYKDIMRFEYRWLF